MNYSPKLKKWWTISSVEASISKWVALFLLLFLLSWEYQWNITMHRFFSRVAKLIQLHTHIKKTKRFISLFSLSYALLMSFQIFKFISFLANKYLHVITMISQWYNYMQRLVPGFVKRQTSNANRNWSVSHW